MKKKIGLFIDTFQILHRGHQLCIKYALQEMDEVIALIYDNTSSKIPLSVRSNWIKKLYPNIKIIESWFDLEERESTTNAQRRFLKEKLGDREITKLYTTNSNLEHICQTLNCKDAIKPSIKGKMQKNTNKVQENNHKYISYIDPIVYRDLITNIAFVGAQSTGKSTMAEAMAKKYNTGFMFEYGRYHWDVYQKDRIETLEQIEEITERQLAMEEERLKKANKYLFTDTCPLITLRYAYDWHGRATPKLLNWAKEAETRYDIFFLCGDDIPYADTPERDGIEQRTSFQNQIKSELITRKIPYIELKGTLQQRMDKVDRVLSEYKKYTSLAKNIGNVPQKKQDMEK
ncbi:MAG: AAA family ATPase [Clostridia bacterium]|nr:AAA family ATPase [Clostridia bacterium]